jgi:hypothetical protein
VQVTLNCECTMILRQSREGIAGTPRPDGSWQNFWMMGKGQTGQVCYWPNGNERASCGYWTTQNFDIRDARKKTPSTTPRCYERGRCRAPR